MAHKLSELPPDNKRSGDEVKDGLRRCRGRPRLTDSDRAQRRLESRKKYDVRRVYLGESHKLWTELRRRTSLSDAGLAEYLILLNSTYGNKYQQKYCGKKISPEVQAEEEKGRRSCASSLQSLVCWYQEHSRSCAHEPQLRTLEPRPGCSTAAIWECHSSHSFVQYLFSPQREANDCEHQDRANENTDVETAAEVPVNKVSRKRREEEAGHQQLKDATLAGQSIWEMEIEMGSVFQPAGESAASEEAAEGLQQGQDGEERKETVKHGDEGATTVPDGYTCGPVATPSADKADEDSVLSQRLSGSLALGSQMEMSVPPPMQVPEQGEMFDVLPTVVTSCEIPNQRAGLQGSQLIIITGTSCEALASDSIQLSVGSGNVEEVTCTVIGGVNCSQACLSDSNPRTAEDEDTVTGLSNKQLLKPTADPVDMSRDRKLQRSLSSIRLKRNRRGPVVEADGMLKMFHCPYEGCTQVYVAISSFQNHVNLVHRKGRTKVCPHPGCGKKFYLSNHLHRHMIIHSGIRDFICETCGKSFKRKNHLEVHRRTHTGETPLQCEICGYQCRQRASLNWHMKKHTSEAHYNFTCEFCGKKFEKLESVKFHKLKSHPDTQAT
ncbi:zinc finger protein 653 isoform X2 [Thalassophryne amazonica]|uniref:zinc finger protein 653 isoform X2 n=1 Tax=Thalassophryne amazonica TaxID=390379 RepID=UPI0014708AD2|nr:zinc finger protein 653 isoform X2 [Thalassophryne amazonica]